MYIYILTNTVNGKKYVGQTIRKNLKIRIDSHFIPTDDTRPLYRSIRKHDRKQFSAEVISYFGASRKALNAIEQWYISKQNTQVPNGYNLTANGQGKGRKHTTKTRAKMSKTHKGKPGTFKGKKHTLEARAKMSKANKGRVFTIEHRAKISKAARKRKHSPETRAKISRARKKNTEK